MKKVAEDFTLQSLNTGAETVERMLLRTKLNTPKPRDDTLLRPRLIKLLQDNLDKPLILVMAPAGYGKTTLLAQFTADAPLPVSWYQLDAGDNDPAIFFEYLVECLAGRYPEFGSITGCCPEFGPTPRSLLQSIENIAAEWQRFLVVLINEIVETVPGDILLILEDYHLIENPLIHSFVDRLLAQAPPQLHLLISTRSDPLISLARLRLDVRWLKCAPATWASHRLKLSLSSMKWPV